MLVAFNAAPRTVVPRESGPYGAYAQALAEMIRTGGLPLAQCLIRFVCASIEMTKGGVVPWNASKIDPPFLFFERAPDAPPVGVSNDQILQSTIPTLTMSAGDCPIAAGVPVESS